MITETAFPSEKNFQSGLTKREYFAAQALQGLLASGKHQPWDSTVSAYNANLKDVAEGAVDFADALVDQLSLRPKQR